MGLLATGGMAQVYLALSGQLSGFRTLVVVKRILPHLASNTQFIKMFFDEARIVALLDHPNIVRIIEVGQDGDEYFLAMEVVQGRPLSSLLRRAVKRENPVPHPVAALIVAQAAKGLGYAHDLADAEGRPLNIVHRDVSPQNILVSFEGAVKLIDFGVARAFGRVTETSPGGLKGKIQYMAPEQASAGTVDRRSDVFALGVVLWEALCGRRLFRRDNELATLHAIVDEPIVPPSQILHVSPRLERIVMRALEKNPDHRFQNAEDMALALERHAFASEGFSPLQVVTIMKDLFAPDHARWKRTVATAMNLDGPPESWPDTEGTFLLPQKIGAQTQGATVALGATGAHRRVDVAGSSQGLSQGSSSDSRSIGSSFTLADGPAWRGRSWVAAALGLASLVVFLAILGVTRRPGATMMVVKPAESGSSRTLVERLAPAVAQQLAPADPGGPAAGGATGIASGAAAPLSPPASTSLVVPATTIEPPSPTFTSSRTPARKRGARLAGRLPSARAARASADEGPIAEPTFPAAENPIMCSMMVGTRPWAEVWIDGRNTREHTPYSENISCGRHKLTFKRQDLDIEKTVAITVHLGETFKRSFSLHGE